MRKKKPPKIEADPNVAVAMDQVLEAATYIAHAQRQEMAGDLRRAINAMTYAIRLCEEAWQDRNPQPKK